MNILCPHEVVRVAGGLSPTPLPSHGAAVLPGGGIDRRLISLPVQPPLSPI